MGKDINVIFKKKRDFSVKNLSKKLSANIGYVYIPSNLDRDSFVKNCFKKQTISIISKSSKGLSNDIQVPRNILSELDFPEISGEYGSRVLWLKSTSGSSIVIAKLTEEGDLYSLSENSFSLYKKYQNNLIEISGDAKAGEIYIDINNKNEDSEGSLIINIKSKNEKGGNAKIVLDGSFFIESEKDLNLLTGNSINLTIGDISKKDEKITEIKYIKGTGFSYKDEFGNELSIIKDKINIGKGNEPAVLGNSLTALLSDIITQISAITVTTVAGPAPILNKAAVEALKKDVDKIKSKLINLD